MNNLLQFQNNLIKNICTTNNTNNSVNDSNSSSTTTTNQIFLSQKIKKSISLVKTIKNKKEVYCRSKKLLERKRKKKGNSECSDESEHKFMRRSKFRGVSKNGNQWQVLIMINKKKCYIGNYKTETEAASVYDVAAIQYHGNKAKTNYAYTYDEIIKIQKDKSDCYN
jgi:hypothetical protein